MINCRAQLLHEEIENVRVFGTRKTVIWKQVNKIDPKKKKKKKVENDVTVVNVNSGLQMQTKSCTSIYE